MGVAEGRLEKPAIAAELARIFKLNAPDTGSSIQGERLSSALNCVGAAESSFEPWLLERVLAVATG
jgi:hypothetical protein